MRSGCIQNPPWESSAATHPPNGGMAHDDRRKRGAVTEEDRLIARVRAGDARAFEGLYRLHVNRIYALCLRMTASRSEAEDRTQEVFVRAWEKIDSFEGNSAFHTWLHRIAVNLLISAHRKRAIRRDHDQPHEIPAGQHPTAAPDRTPERLDLEAALARLPERARTVFVLHVVEGYQHDEIAALTGMAVGTSKAQSHRARKLLREMLS